MTVWREQDRSNRLATIYSRSLLTLVAVSGKDASNRLPGVQKGTRAPDAHPVPWQPGTLIAKRTPYFLSSLQRSEYITRAWCFQKRLLSKRCLYFLEDQAYFQCQSSIWCEDRLVNCAEDLRILNPLTALSGSAPASALISSTLHGLFLLYLPLVTEYTQKKLTNPSDIVNAFAGLMGMIQDMRGIGRGRREEDREHNRAGRMEDRPLGTGFIHGLPESIIDAALLWCAFDSNPVRRSIDHRFADANTLLEPSWSWTGWESPINYDTTLLWGGKLSSCVAHFIVVTRKPEHHHHHNNNETVSYFVNRQVEDVEPEISETTSWPGDTSEQLVRRLLALDRLEEFAATTSLPASFRTCLLFEASWLPLAAFKFTHHPVIWKIPGVNAGLVREGQLAVRVYQSRITNGKTAWYQCGAIYGVNQVSRQQLKDFYLVALSEIQYTPAHPYVHAKVGHCWKGCCSQPQIWEIFDEEYLSEETGAC